MIRSTLVLCVGILAAVCAACGPQPAVLEPPSKAGPTARATGVCDANNPPLFLQKAYMLDPSYNPDPGGGMGTPPTVGPRITEANPATKQYFDSLCAAYNMASNNAASPFQQQLDNLTNTFVVSNQTCANGACVMSSWGLRDRDSKKTFIALSSGLWNWDGTGALPTYDMLESTICANLLGIPKCPVTIKAFPETLTTTVLAALAHELGHVKWWEQKVASFTCKNPPPGSNPSFVGSTWSATESAQSWTRYRGFGTETVTNLPMGGLVDRHKVRQDLQTAPGNVNGDLANIYSGAWASLFATVAPDEDFIETYKLWALTSASSNPLTTLTITVAPTSSTPVQEPIVAPGPMGGYTTNSNFILYNKTQWIQSCLTWP